MTHTPTQDAGVYRCPACAFHAIATQQGIRVLNSGIGRALHMEAIAQQQIELRAHVEALLQRLVQAYNERRALLLPRSDGRHDVRTCPHIQGRMRGDPTKPCTCVSNMALSMRTVRALSRHIKAEYLS